MRRAVAVATALVLVVWFSFLAAPRTAAFPLSTCTLTVTSLDPSGAQIGTATGDGPGGTRDAPLEVDRDGTVEWIGTTGGASTSGGSYHVEIFGVPSPLSGSIKSGGSVSSSSDSVKLGDVLPFDLVGLVYVSGAIDVGGSPVCEGSGWIRLRGDPVTTPLFLGGAATAMLGAAGLLASVRRRRLILGTFAGLLAGAGLAVLSGVTGTLPFDEKTPLATVIGGIVLGFLLGAIDVGGMFGRGATAQEAAGAGASPSVATAPAEPAAQPDTQPATQPAGGQEPPAPAPVAEPPATAVPTPAVPPGTSTSPGAATSGTAHLAPKPGLDALRGWKDSLPSDDQADVAPILANAEAILRSGPGALTIGSDVIGRFLDRAARKAAAKGESAPPSVHLEDGAIVVGDNVLRASPVVSDGKVGLSFIDTKADAGAAGGLQFLAGVVIEGISKASQVTGISAGPLDGLNWFVDQVNQAVRDAGQHVTAVSVTPAGITLTTGPATTG
jgi:hypothetical protein